MSHFSRTVEKVLDKKRSKLQANTLELKVAKQKLKAEKVANEKKFNEGFVFSLILLVRSYDALHEHAFNILDEAGYDALDFDVDSMDPEDFVAFRKIFSI